MPLAGYLDDLLAAMSAHWLTLRELGTFIRALHVPQRGQTLDWFEAVMSNTLGMLKVSEILHSVITSVESRRFRTNRDRRR